MADTQYKGVLQTGATEIGRNAMAHNTKNYNQFGYFTQGIDVTRQGLDQMTPYVPGISRIFMHHVPEYMNVGFSDMTNNFKSYIETAYKSINGINDLDVEFIELEGGFAQQSFANVSQVKDNSTELTIEVYEMDGSPVRDFIETWVTGVRDPRSGVAHYHGMIDGTLDGAEKVEYQEKNHTAEFLYYTLDPTARRIEYACLWAHCFPTKVTKDHLNYSSGQRDAVIMSLGFRGMKYEGRYINDLAAYYLQKDMLEYSYLNFNPYRDGSVGDENNGKINYQLNLPLAANAQSVR